MKILFTFFLLFAIPVQAIAEKGAFLLQRNSYIFENIETKKGRRYYTKRRVALNVTDIHQTKKNKVYIQVIYPFLKENKNGTGYICKNDNELQEIVNNNVKVYSKLPLKLTDLTSFVEVPSTQLSFTGKSNQSSLFPQVEWREVDYKVSLNKKIWIPLEAGIFRPDKNSEWLEKTSKILFKKRYKYKLRKLILSGLIEKGFTKEQVLLSLGEPIKKIDKDDSEESEWEYADKKVIFKGNNVIQTL